MIKRYAPIALIVAAACGGSDGSGPKTPPSDIGSMAVGDVRVLVPADIPNGIDLPAGSGARDYVIMVGNTSPSHDVVANYVVKADRSPTGVFGLESSADMAASRYSVQLGEMPLARTSQQAVDNKVRAFERSNLALKSRGGLLDGSRFSIRRSANAAAMAVPAVGDVINVKIPDEKSNNLCDNFFQTQAVVASVSRRAILAVDTLDGPPAALFSQAALDSITAEFDNVTYPTDSSYFHNPTDVDGNGHVILLFTGQVNKLTPPNTPGGFVAGFFFAGDFFPPTDQGGGANTFCAQSNREEIFYLLSPDPTGLKFGNVRSASSVRQGTRGTIAHEFQHMINAGNRLLNPAVSEFESTWLDEALAHFAEDAVGRVSRGFADLRPLTFADVLPCNSPCAEANDFNAFFFQNLARLTYWMDAPDKFSPMSKMADTSLATRGAAWAFVRYGADNFSNGDPRALTRVLATGPDTGVKNFVAATKSNVDTLVKGWLVSMYADHLGIANLPAQYQYRSYNFHSVMPPVAKAVLGQASATYPLRIQSIGSGSDNISATNRSGTGTYYRFTVAAGAGAKNVKILDSSGANNASFSGEHIYVLRIQ
ncbi:MAG TPA: hypothetical protein VGN73_06185 [Gemmatimonadaceae bacterium]|nr:hypothetical protein [Gemmatimonadaceae bacterium]